MINDDINFDNTINNKSIYIVTSKINIPNELTKGKEYKVYNTYQGMYSTQPLIVNNKNYEKYYDKDFFHYEVMN